MNPIQFRIACLKAVVSQAAPRRAFRRRFEILGVLSAILAYPGAVRAANQLDINPSFQETPAWCWVTVGEMIFRYYGVRDINPVGNFQCGIIALLGPACNVNCGNCIVPAGRLATIRNMLVQYSQVASDITHTDTHILASTAYRALSMTEVRTEIDDGRPIVAGISPSGNPPPGSSEHVALIIGYHGADVIVDDPFPYDRAFHSDPYTFAGGRELEEGRYRINRTAFIEKLRWRESVYDIRCSGTDCDQESSSANSSQEGGGDDAQPALRYGRSCQTPYVHCGPFFNQPSEPLGSACYCATPYGPSAGVVVP